MRGIHALRSVDYPKEFRNTTYYRFIQEKINEIEISLRYSDLISFGRYMVSRKKEVESNLDHVSITFEDDLQVIEESLADKFSLLFYIGLLRENNHLASRYPLTTAFMKPGIGRYNSITYPQYGSFCIKENKLKLAFVDGLIELKLHRPFVAEKIKMCTIVRDIERWFACFSL